MKSLARLGDSEPSTSTPSTTVREARSWVMPETLGHPADSSGSDAEGVRPAHRIALGRGATDGTGRRTGTPA